MTYSYQLTPLGVPMPGLFVSEEISTKRTSCSSTDCGSSSGSTLRRRSAGGDARCPDERFGGYTSPPPPHASFAVRGGRPRSTVSWTVTTVAVQDVQSSPGGGGASFYGGAQGLAASSTSLSSDASNGEEPVGR